MHENVLNVSLNKINIKNFNLVGGSKTYLSGIAFAYGVMGVTKATVCTILSVRWYM